MEVENKANLLARQFPDSGFVWGMLGAAQLTQGKDALSALQMATKLLPDDAIVHCNMGIALQNSERFADAVASYRRALQIEPNNSLSHYSLGNVFKSLGQLDNAVASYRRALQGNPDFAEAHNNMGVALRALGQVDAAVTSFRGALKIKPQYSEAHCNLGNALRELEQLDDAVTSYRLALQFKPDFAVVHLNLGNVLRDQGLLHEAVASYLLALKFKPDFGEVRWQLAMARIPMIADSSEEIETCRAQFPHVIAELSACFDDEQLAQGYQAVGSSLPFYLAYQEENNRDFLLRYGKLCVRLMKQWHEKQIIPATPVLPDAKVRVGIISAHIHRHSVWDAIVKGWVTHLDRNRIELNVFHVGSRLDDESLWAKSNSSSFTQGKRSLAQWTQAILEKHADVLVYPEIGMDEMTIKLASLRLAPVQVTSWGHPETSGLPTMDYFLSAEYFEPPEAQNNYTEKLICLPNLGCHYQAPHVASAEPDFASLGIDSGIPVILCPGVPFKYAPQHDRVLVEIARSLGRCQLVLFTHGLRGLSEKLNRRLEVSFATANMDSKDYLKFIPWQDKASFYGLMKHADIFLDTIGFSGFNTAMQAVECGLPIVTREGQFMRGRLASGILRRIGLTELIAGTEEEYVNLAVKLVREAEYRQGVHHRIEMSRDVLFDDVAPVRALEDFLIKAVKHRM